LVGTLMGDKARALVALDHLMQAPDLAPLSVVDKALGDLKSASRVDQAVRRTQGQGIAAQAVKNLEAAVTDMAKRGGKDVYQALLEGRAATVSKHETLAALDMFGTEAAANNSGRVISPTAVYNKLTADKEGALNALRTIQRIAPDQIPEVGRAYLEELMRTAQREGGFGHADKLWSEWMNLGKETKEILFPNVAHRVDVQNFLFLAKRISERGPNTSNTAYQLNATKVAMAAPSWVMARILYSPKIAQRLMYGVRTNNPSIVSKVIEAATVVGGAQIGQQ
jgi:hypothetical protein